MRTPLLLKRDERKSRPTARSRIKAFTLVELLAVIAIIGVLLGVVIPVVNGIIRGNEVTNAADKISGALEVAKNYAVTKNTYVWVGFLSEDASVPSNQVGIGRVVVSAVASKDGTSIVDLSAAAPGGQIDSQRLVAINPIIKMDNVYLGDLTPPLTPLAAGGGTNLETRASVDPASRISETTPSDTKFPFKAVLGTVSYQFTKTILFNPRGEAVLNSTNGIVPWLEIGIKPSRGNLAMTNDPNVCAIQVAGITGAVKTFRKM